MHFVMARYTTLKSRRITIGMLKVNKALIQHLFKDFFLGISLKQALMLVLPTDGFIWSDCNIEQS